MPRRLPPNPHIDVLKKEARTLLNDLKAGDEAAWLLCKTHHPRLFEHKDSDVVIPSLNTAQLILAREYGYKSWVRLRAAVMDIRQDHDRTDACSFCGLSVPQVLRLITGPDVHICNDCVGTALDHIVRGKAPQPGRTSEPSDEMCCSFCREGMHAEDRGMMFVGSQANICGPCIRMCVDILSEVWGKDKQGQVVSL